MVLTYYPEAEAIDHLSRELEADSRVLQEMVSGVALAVLALATMTEKIENLFPLEDNLMKKVEVSSNKDHLEEEVVSEAVTLLMRDLPKECMLEEEVLAPAPLPI